MFERFTRPAREVVLNAQKEARALRHGWIGTEHLLLALMTDTGGGAATTLAGFGLTSEAIRAEITRLLGAHGFGDQDADALRAIGIDLDAVRVKVEEAFGPGALERRQDCNRRGRRRLRRVTGHIPFTPRAKKVLELALREALRLRHNWIGPEHILLGLLRERDGLAVQVLTVRGVALDALRQRTLTVLGAAA